MLKRFSKYILVIISITLITTGCSNKLNIISNKDDLNNKNIGVYTGSEYDTIVQDNIENPKILYYNSYSDQISALIISETYAEKYIENTIIATKIGSIFIFPKIPK